MSDDTYMKREFWSELGLFVTRPHRAFLLLVMVILGASACMAMAREPMEVFKASLEASKWVLGIIGGTALLRKAVDKGTLKLGNGK